MINHAKDAEIKRRIEAGEFAAGHYFCGGCQRVTELDVDGSWAKCVICGSARVKWCDLKRDYTPAPEKRDGEAVTVPGSTARQWFNEMRHAADQTA